jgi:hypothetical protein
MSNRRWSSKEIEYLKENWGNKSIGAIAKKLGRTKNAIICKKNKLKLSPFLDSNKNGAVTMHALTTALNFKDFGNGYKKVAWVQKRGLPTHKLRVDKQTFKVIYIHEFWEWAEKNQDFLDFSKFEKYSLGAEPEWVEKKRARDRIRLMHFASPKQPWTKDEDERLIKYLKEFKYSWTDISNKLHRTCAGIQKRCTVLGLKERPLRESTRSKWTDEQLQVLNEMIEDCCNYQEMTSRIGKSEKAIRGKVYWLYKTESLDKARIKMKEKNINDKD